MKNFFTVIALLIASIATSFAQEKLIFTTNDGNYNHSVYTVNIDGTGLTEIINDSYYHGGVAATKDGSIIVYDRRKTALHNMDTLWFCKANSDGTNEQVVGYFKNPYNDVLYNQSMDISSDGNYLVFALEFTGNRDSHIYELNMTTGVVTQLTTTEDYTYVKSGPRYYANDTKIAYTRRMTDWYAWPHKFYTMNKDGSNPTVFLEPISGGSYGRICFFSNPSKIIFSYEPSSNNSKIYTYDIANSALVNLNLAGWTPLLNKDDDKFVFVQDWNKLIVSDLSGNVIGQYNMPTGMSCGYFDWISAGTSITAHIAQNDTTVCSGSAVSLNVVSTLPTEDLICHYPFNGNANDESGHGFNGIVNGATLTTDRFGNTNSAYSFNGVSSDIEFSQEFTFHQQTDASISMWIKCNEATHNAFLWSKLNSVDANRFHGYVNSTGSTMELLIDYREANVNIHYLLNKNGLSLNTWYHYVVTRTTNTYKLFIDSQYIMEFTDTNPNLPTEIGWIIGGRKSNQNNFNGKLDDIRIYHRALSQSEITALFNENSTPSNYSFLWSTGDTTASITVAPTQTTTYFVTISDGIHTTTDSVIVSVTSASLSGKLYYDNTPANSTMSCTKIYLKTVAGSSIDSTTTDYYGNYRFCNVPNGSYKLGARTIKSWGGVNNVDALQVLRHYTEFITLSGLRFKAGDVNNSGYINSTDAFIITKRYLEFIDEFPIEDWIFEEPIIDINGTSAIVIDFKGICAGDVNGTYNPPDCSFNNCGDTLTDIRDGQKYPTVQIGTQCWMKKNLNIGAFTPSVNTGSEHSDVSNNGIIEKYCYDNDQANCAIYGGLYDWNELMQYTTIEGTEGICPVGWHIPSDPEWSILTTFLGGESIAGGKMKEAGFIHWTSPNSGATNDCGLTVMGAGFRHYQGQFGLLNVYGYFSTSTTSSGGWNGNAWRRSLDIYSPAVNRNDDSKALSLSIRCVKTN